MKHRIVHLLQKHLLNPPIKLLFAIGVAPPGYALLETTGRNWQATLHAVIQKLRDLHLKI